MRETGGGNAGRAWGAERLDTQRGLLWRASDVPAQLPRQLRGVSEKEGQKPAHRLRAGSLARSTGCRRTERLAGRFYPLNTGQCTLAYRTVPPVGQGSGPPLDVGGVRTSRSHGRTRSRIARSGAGPRGSTDTGRGLRTGGRGRRVEGWLLFSPLQRGERGWLLFSPLQRDEQGGGAIACRLSTDRPE